MLPLKCLKIVPTANYINTHHLKLNSGNLKGYKMNNSEYLLEVSILSTVLFSHHLCEDEKYFDNLELQEEWFLVPFHRIIVRAINHHKMKCEPIYEEFIADSLLKRNQLDFTLWNAIISANPFSKQNFETYLNKLKEPKKSAHWDI